MGAREGSAGKVPTYKMYEDLNSIPRTQKQEHIPVVPVLGRQTDRSLECSGQPSLSKSVNSRFSERLRWRLVEEVTKHGPQASRSMHSFIHHHPPSYPLSNTKRKRRFVL